jgi:hypothetical protein
MFFLCGILLAPILRAQSTTTSSSTREVEAQPNFWRRFSFGVRASILTLPLQNSTGTQSSPNTLTLLTNSLTPASSRFDGGATVEYAATRRILVSADILYQFFSYSSEVVTTVSLADGTSQITTADESTHARYWTIPVLARYATLPARTASAQVFIGAGGAFRKISGIRTTTSTVNPDGTTVTDYTPRTPQKLSTFGAVATAGFRVKDEFGIRITPEVRYTRWLSDLFNSWPAKQRRNELSVIIGLTF